MASFYRHSGMLTPQVIISMFNGHGNSSTSLLTAVKFIEFTVWPSNLSTTACKKVTWMLTGPF